MQLEGRSHIDCINDLCSTEAFSGDSIYFLLRIFAYNSKSFKMALLAVLEAEPDLVSQEALEVTAKHMLLVHKIALTASMPSDH